MGDLEEIGRGVGECVGDWHKYPLPKKEDELVTRLGEILHLYCISS